MSLLMALMGSAAIFPVPSAAPAVSSQASGTTFNATMPTHVAGNVLIAFVSNAGATALTASGWTSAATTLNTNVRVTVFTKVAASGSETISISNSNNAQITAHIYACDPANGAVEATSVASGNDPPSLTPTWGATSTLWFAAEATNNANITAADANYTATFTNTQVNARLASGYFAKAGASEDPGVFTGPVGADRAVATAGVRPL